MPLLAAALYRRMRDLVDRKRQWNRKDDNSLRFRMMRYQIENRLIGDIEIAAQQSGSPLNFDVAFAFVIGYGDGQHLCRIACL